MKKTENKDKQPALQTAVQKPLQLISKFIKKPFAVMTPAEKREAENMGVQQASLRRAEQEMLTLSLLSNFSETQEQMLNSRMAQMMHKIGHVKLPFLRMTFMAKSRRILGRQRPRIEASKIENRQPQKIRMKKRPPQSLLMRL
ncbi:MAG TPA: hypothetical protein VHP34_08565 [Alphaproteobacteria bacterium]|jgi:hypothetical protein|nr:hypothetical protein [Alphaproteobacteria bacterium]